MLCNQPLTKWPKPHTWTLIHRRKLQISIAQVQPSVSDPVYLSDKGIKPPQRKQLPTLLKGLDRKNFKLNDFWEYNQLSIKPLINSSENRQTLEILRGNVKVLPLLFKSSRKQAVTPLTAWIQLNSNLGFWLYHIPFATSENEILLPNMHGPSLAKENKFVLLLPPRF